MCESRGGRPGLPVPNSPYGLCGRKATWNFGIMIVSAKRSEGEKYAYRNVKTPKLIGNIAFL